MRPNPQETADLIAFTEKVLNRKLHFLCSVTLYTFSKYWVFLWSRKTAWQYEMITILIKLYATISILHYKWMRWEIYERLCAIWNHLYNSKNEEKTYGGVLLLGKLHHNMLHFANSNTLECLIERGGGVEINGLLENSSKFNKRGGGQKIFENLIAGGRGEGNFIWYGKIE